MADIPGRPDWGALRGMMADLQKATKGLPDLQDRMMSLTGTAWSPDGMIKAVVGPRGHLLELDINPRLLRQPNSQALSASIVATVRAAVEEVGAQGRDLIQESLPADMRHLGDGGMTGYIGTHDADVLIRSKDRDE
ncbi:MULTISPECIES: YbaB/EbfC family nucleoid-associated protein [Actinoplanes]|uniref:YbaB/EbfC family nucleoid-associated protein n=1 Tax=Actinoplanes TaxID=1865 RepID=UPI00069875D2|nr:MULTISPECIES: YbaB/EbfC family nucleoid-associated protein [Actinoplanes]GLY01592.1 hypothetical protein Acsp01_19710 [Actinoplanes sp. NBRC 101535]